MPYIVQRYSNSTTSYSGSSYQSFTGGTSKLKIHSGNTTTMYPLTTNTSASQYCKFKVKVGTKIGYLAKKESISNTTSSTRTTSTSRKTYSTATKQFSISSQASTIYTRGVYSTIRQGTWTSYTSAHDNRFSLISEAMLQAAASAHNRIALAIYAPPIMDPVYATSSSYSYINTRSWQDINMKVSVSQTHPDFFGWGHQGDFRQTSTNSTLYIHTGAQAAGSYFSTAGISEAQDRKQRYSITMQKTYYNSNIVSGNNSTPIGSTVYNIRNTYSVIVNGVKLIRLTASSRTATYRISASIHYQITGTEITNAITATTVSTWTISTSTTISTSNSTSSTTHNINI